MLIPLIESLKVSALVSLSDTLTNERPRVTFKKLLPVTAGYLLEVGLQSLGLTRAHGRVLHTLLRELV